MIKLKVFLICLSVVLVMYSGIVCMEMYALERALARGFYSDILDDMQDIGYLDELLVLHYQNEMLAMGWESNEEDFFLGTYPREEAVRARKEHNETVTVTLTIRPSRISQWLHLFFYADTSFVFSGSRPSEYFDPGW